MEGGAPPLVLSLAIQPSSREQLRQVHFSLHQLTTRVYARRAHIPPVNEQLVAALFDEQSNSNCNDYYIKQMKG